MYSSVVERLWVGFCSFVGLEGSLTGLAFAIPTDHSASRLASMTKATTAVSARTGSPATRHSVSWTTRLTSPAGAVPP